MTASLLNAIAAFVGLCFIRIESRIKVGISNFSVSSKLHCFLTDAGHITGHVPSLVEKFDDPLQD
jgi:hypothetical protein